MYATLRESKAKLSDLVERASSGEEVVITVRGHPKARLCPIEAEMPLDGAAFVRELEALQTRYLTRKKLSPPAEALVSEFREDRT